MEPPLIDLKTLLRAIPNKWIEHTFREENQYADALARKGSRRSFPFVVFVDPPPVVDAILAFDKANIFVTNLFLIYK